MTAPREFGAATRSGAIEPGVGTVAPASPPVLPRTLRILVCRTISALLIRHPFPGANRLRRRLADLLMPAPQGPVVVQTIMGCSLLVDPLVNKGLEREVYYHGAYEVGTMYVLSNVLRPGDTFLDVGANIGLVTLVASQLVGRQGRVYAFEPVAGTIAILERNIALNDARNVCIKASALGAVDETRPVYEHLKVNRGAASFVPIGDASSSAIVPVTTLDTFVHSAGLEGPIRAIKIDVEGWESQVLAGGRQLLADSAAPVLVVEYSTKVRLPKGAHTDLYDLIRSLNEYRLFCLERGKEVISRLREIHRPEDLPREDNLICLLPMHLQETRVRALLKGG